MLRGGKALQEVIRRFDYSLAAVCGAAFRQLGAAAGCNNGSFSAAAGLLVPSITFRAEVTGPTCCQTSKALQVSSVEKVRQQEGVDFLGLRSPLQLAYKVRLRVVSTSLKTSLRGILLEESA